MTEVRKKKEVASAVEAQDQNPACTEADARLAVKDVVRAARHPTVNFTHSDKLRWCTKHLTDWIRSGVINKKLIAQALDAAQGGSTQREPVPYTRDVLLADLRFVLWVLRRRRIRWTRVRILMALVIVCEARRSSVATGRVAERFFVSERTATRLLGGRCTRLARSLEPLIRKPGDPQNRLYLVQLLDPGNRFRASRMKACRTLQDHLRAHRTPKAGECVVNDDNLLEALVEALGGRQDFGEIEGVRVDVHVSKDVHIDFVSSVQKVVIPIAAVSQPERTVTCEPVSWVDPWRPGSPGLVAELQLVREPVELMARTGLGDVQMDRVKELLEEAVDESMRSVLRRIVDRCGADGRLRSRFRLSSNASNRITGYGGSLGVAVQSIPKDLLWEIVEAPAGKAFVHFDLRAVDALSVALLSGDRLLLQVYERDDVYTVVSRTILDSDERERGKTLFHLGVHGAGRSQLAKLVGINEAEVDEHLRRLWNLFPGVRAYLDRCIEHGRKYQRSLPSITGWYRHLAAPSPAACVNAPIAGTSGDLFRAFVSRFHRVTTARGVLAPHVLSAYDGGMWELPDGQANAVRDLISATMDSIRSDFQLPVVPRGKWSVSPTSDA